MKVTSNVIFSNLTPLEFGDFLSFCWWWVFNITRGLIQACWGKGPVPFIKDTWDLPRPASPSSHSLFLCLSCLSLPIPASLCSLLPYTTLYALSILCFAWTVLHPILSCISTCPLLHPIPLPFQFHPSHSPSATDRQTDSHTQHSVPLLSHLNFSPLHLSPTSNSTSPISLDPTLIFVVTPSRFLPSLCISFLFLITSRAQLLFIFFILPSIFVFLCLFHSSFFYGFTKLTSEIM